MSEAKAKYLAAKAAFEETFEKHLQNGVEFISDQVFIDPEVEIAPGAVILPGCILRGKTVIGANCVIGPNTLLENTIVEAGSTVNASQCYDSHLGPNNKIGPFTHVRINTVTGYGACVTEREDIALRRGKVHYALLPVWMLSTKWRGQDFLFAMNGQTGKLVGDLPTDRGRFWGMFAAIAAPLTVALTAILQFLL